MKCKYCKLCKSKKCITISPGICSQMAIKEKIVFESKVTGIKAHIIFDSTLNSTFTLEYNLFSKDPFNKETRIFNISHWNFLNYYQLAKGNL